MKKLTKMQTLFIIIALAIVAAFTDLSLAKLYNANQQKHLYPLTTTVTEIKKDTVTVEDSNGNLWSFNGAEDWEINDSCALIMNDNNTKDIHDDTIISTRYQVGGKVNDGKRNQIQTQSEKRIIKDSYVASGINNWLHPHCNYI